MAETKYTIQKRMDGKRKLAAEILALGGRNVDAANAAQVSVTSIVNWKKKEDFQAMVAAETEKIEGKSMASELPALFDKKFGAKTPQEMGQVFLARLAFCATFDPAEFQNPDGSWKPLCEVPYEHRIACITPGNDRNPPKFIDPCKAMVDVLGAMRLRVDAEKRRMTPLSQPADKTVDVLGRRLPDEKMVELAEPPKEVIQ